MLIVIGCNNAYANKSHSNDDVLFACMTEELKTAEPDQTIADLQKQCREKSTDYISQRKIFEAQTSSNPFAILPYKPNYVLPVSYFKPNYAPYADFIPQRELDEVEVKFQISLKYVVVEQLFIDELDMLVAFTSTSWWQAYNGDLSAPFRETNYEPELIFNYKKPWSFIGLKIENSFISFNHQSNGQTGKLSRSWNRVIGGAVFTTGDLVWGVRVWWRFPESAKTLPDDSSGDDNPDIEKFMGNGEIGMRWPINKNHKIDILLRNNLSRDNKGAITLGWTFPMRRYLHGYVEYFNGYGESLIYYNEDIERISFGVKITDWL